MRYYIVCILILLLLTACRGRDRAHSEMARVVIDSTLLFSDSGVLSLVDTNRWNETDHSGFGNNPAPIEVVNYAKTLLGTKYAFACSSPDAGFDCSGFVNYVFGHFDMEVPRSSRDFTDIGKEVPVANARPGDLILFTGTNSEIRIVGHLGIVVYNDSDSLSFIHASSGKVNAVTITPLNEGYKRRFMKITRVLSAK